MALIDLPSDFKFKHIMSHTLPGFFSAITLYMLIDLWSPIEITPMITKDLGGFATFLGLVFLIGTILGIIQDGIHHSIIEDIIFDSLPGIETLKGIRNEWIQRCDGLAFNKSAENFKGWNLTRHYSFKTIESKLTEINNFVIEDYYSYSEFYSNAFLSLIPFSIIVPYYLLENFQVPWSRSVVFGFSSSIIALVCLFSSYSSYKTYAIVVNSIMLGYVKDKGNESKPAEIKGSVTVGGNLTLGLKGA